MEPHAARVNMRLSLEFDATIANKSLESDATTLIQESSLAAATPRARRSALAHDSHAHEAHSRPRTRQKTPNAA